MQTPWQPSLVSLDALFAKYSLSWATKLVSQRPPDHEACHTNCASAAKIHANSIIDDWSVSHSLSSKSSSLIDSFWAAQFLEALMSKNTGKKRSVGWLTRLINESGRLDIYSWFTLRLWYIYLPSQRTFFFPRTRSFILHQAQSIAYKANLSTCRSILQPLEQHRRTLDLDYLFTTPLETNLSITPSERSFLKATWNACVRYI